MKKIKSFLPILSTVFVLTTTSCSGTGKWNKMSKDTKEINYALFIGQLDHNDSNARTYGTRKAFGTHGGREGENAPNEENSFKPSVNEHFVFKKEDFTTAEQQKWYDDNNIGSVEFVVTEKEHSEQRSTGGATWDLITANQNTSLWISKHGFDSWKDRNGNTNKGQSLTFMASNNDGMAMGALGSKWFPEGLPIFGYDANADALEAVAKGKLTGTIECNVTAQVASVYMLIRNVLHGYTGEEIFERGFKNFEDESKTKYSPYGYISGKVVRQANNFSLMSSNVSITQKDKGGDKLIDDYVSQDPETHKYVAKTSTERYENDEKHTHLLTDQEAAEHDVTFVAKDKETLNIYQTYYSNTDTFLISSVEPLFNLLADKDHFNANITQFKGNGNDDEKCQSDLRTQISASKSKDKPFDAYIINMVKQDSASKYLDIIYEENGKTLVDKPVIFFNRQPKNIPVMDEYVKNGKFKFIYYVGMDAVQGGEVQGEMMKKYLAQEFYKSSIGDK